VYNNVHTEKQILVKVNVEALCCYRLPFH